MKEHLLLPWDPAVAMEMASLSSHYRSQEPFHFPHILLTLRSNPHISLLHWVSKQPYFPVWAGLLDPFIKHLQFFPWKPSLWARLHPAPEEITRNHIFFCLNLDHKISSGHLSLQDSFSSVIQMSSLEWYPELQTELQACNQKRKLPEILLFSSLCIGFLLLCHKWPQIQWLETIQQSYLKVLGLWSYGSEVWNGSAGRHSLWRL